MSRSRKSPTGAISEDMLCRPVKRFRERHAEAAALADPGAAG
jgi:hypothetical protein